MTTPLSESLIGDTFLSLSLGDITGSTLYTIVSFCSQRDTFLLLVAGDFMSSLRLLDQDTRLSRITGDFIVSTMGDIFRSTIGLSGR